MLVKFETNAYATITMFEDVAINLLKLMGQSGHIPGAIRPDDIPAALKSLRNGISATQASSAQETMPTSSDGEEPAIGLDTRAVPLIELLEAAAKEEQPVTWQG